MKTTAGVRQLVSDLWCFIEDVSDDDPQRSDKFFALRERVRNFYESEKSTQVRSKIVKRRSLPSLPPQEESHEPENPRHNES